MSSIFACIALCAANTTAQAERTDYSLYAVAATPVNFTGWTSSADLYVANDELRLDLVRNLTSQEKGVGFVLADPESRMIAIGSPPVLPTHFEFIGMDSPRLVRALDIPGGQFLPMGWHFFGRTGPVYFGVEFGQYRTKPYREKLIGVDLSNFSERTLPWEIYRDVHLTGSAGWCPPNHDASEIFPFEDGTITFRYGFQVIKLPWAVPADVRSDRAALLGARVNNGDLLVISKSRGPRLSREKTTDVMILDKSAKLWHTASFPGNAAELRAFGPWLAIVVQDEGVQRTSPGKQERPQAPSKTGYGFDLHMEAERLFRPGKLILYNGKTKARYLIETYQGDSEIVLVDGQTVYYRVNRVIWRANIGRKEIEAPVLIAESEVVTRVHWAFVGPPIVGPVR